MIQVKFSIIVPVFNIAQYISTCIESIVQQDYNNWELILIDDGSTDNSAEICLSYAENDSRIKLITQKNSGVSFARNRGLDIAKGEYVVFIDGDDYLENTKYLSEISGYLPADIIYNPDHIIQYPNGVKKKVSTNIQNKSAIDAGPPSVYLSQNIVDNRWAVWFFVIKREVIDINRIRFDKDIRIGEDADWVFRVSMNAKEIKIIRNASYVYRVNRLGSAMTVKSVASVLSFFTMTERWKQIAELTPSLQSIYILFCNNAMDYVKTLCLYSKGEQKVIFEKIQECGAYKNSNSHTAKKIRKITDRCGYRFCIVIMGIDYRTKLFCSRAKRKLMKRQ